MGFKIRRFPVLAMAAVMVLTALLYPAFWAVRHQDRLWKLALKLQVRSDFWTSPPGKTAGTYFLEIGWAGFLEEDGPDFIIYHLGSELGRWELRPSPGQVPFVQVPVPELKLNYAEGKEEEINFYYSFNPEVISYAGSSPGSQVRLVLPAVPWPRPAEKIPWINRKVTRGNRNLRLRRSLLARNEVREEFNWEEETSIQEPGSLTVHQRSKVRGVLELNKANK
ncbi:MAG: hypothetical protein QME85_06590 [Candidatus Saccharicenans sp.]|nr:hypothetical protein [Candidatus Saccharicenans sp.]MDI6849110.1 hypothetical protein [Candidatus Saccharicenans sp.]